MKTKYLHSISRITLFLFATFFLSCWDTTQTINQDEKNPQINVRAGTLQIPSSGTYDFGQIEIGHTKSSIITIENLGQLFLGLSGPITVSGTDASLFSIDSQPNTTIPPFTYTTFTISFTPDSQGIKTAIITIPSNDPQKTTFTFTVQGQGLIVTSPEINIQYSGSTVNKGDSIHLGSCVVGNSSNFTISIHNSGTADLTLNSPIISGIDQSLFSISTLPANTVAAGSSTDCIISFTPTSTGDKTAIITITNNDADESTFSFTITATATANPQPDIFIMQDTTPLYNGIGIFDFGNVNQGQTSSVTFTIRNTGTANLTLTSPFTISGADASMFAVSDPGSTDIVPNDTTTFTMNFTPSSAGEKNATVSIGNNVSGKTPYTFTIKGTGIAIPEIDILHGAISIANNGNFDIGSTTVNVSKDTIFTITNSGVGILTLKATPIITLTGSPFFTISIDPSETIDPSSSSNFTLRYLPTEPGNHSTIVTIANNDLDENPYTITITGLATSVPTPKIEITKTSQVLLNNSTVDFGGMTVNGTPIDMTFTITNKGDSNLTISDATISAVDFSILTAPTTPVPAGGTTTIVVRFLATSSGNQGATLTITSNDPNNGSFTINLAGKGLNPEINCKINNSDFNSGNTYDFGDLAIGHSKDIIITIENDSSADPLYLTGSPIVTKVSGGEFSVTSQPSKVSIQPSGSTTFSIRFSPTATGNQSAQFIISNNDSDENPYIINVQGNGTNAAIQVDEVAVGGSNNYGNVKCNTGGLVHTFTIRNNGSTDLLLNASNPVIISGTNKDLFILETSPSTTINPSATTTFSIRFNPQTLSDTGNKNATVVIQSNDPNIPLYTFTVQGTGTTPHISVSDGSNTILNGGIFNFPNVNYGSAGISQTFTITNTGDADLLLTGIPKVQISGTGASHFSVTIQPTSPVNALGSTTFTILFNPTSLGTHTATVTISNDTLDTNTFTFTIEVICDDTESPVITITDPPANSYTNGTQTLLFTVADNVDVTSVQAKIGSGTFTDISSGVAINTINGWAAASEGTITIDMQAKDAANNTGIASLSLIKDITPPVITIVSPAENAPINGNQSLQFTVTDVAVTATRAKIDTGTFNNITSPATINTINGWSPPYTGNSITVYIESTDQAGNTGNISRSFFADTTPPTGNITNPTDGSTVSGTITITADADDSGGSGIEYVEFYIDATLEDTLTSSPWEYSWDTTSYLNGSYPLKIRVMDKAGNEYSDDDTTVTVNN
ncbi:MAG: choice-of-anchor D domain-containing protein [Spirochaetes bacterium]|nr:choice-of-anchor D domain-containing protein [Spirochaetota bacterium]